MTWGDVAIAGAGLVSGALSSSSAGKSGAAAQKAADQQTAAAAAASAQQRSDMAPWTQAGGIAISNLSNETAAGGKFNTNFTMADANNSAAETTALAAGKTAIDNSAAARGGLLGTNNIQDNVKFAEDTSASFENQAFNQWLQQNQQQLNAQQSIAQVGQSSAGNVADNVSNLTLGGANAQAGATVAQANIGAANNSNMANQIGTLSQLFGTNMKSSSTSPSTPSYTTPNADGSYNNPTMGGEGVDPSGQFLGGAATAGDYSDERLKTGVKKVGVTHAGLPIYTYRMKGGGPVKMGVMAQDVEKVRPRAVSHDSHGMKMVDYAEVG